MPLLKKTFAGLFILLCYACSHESKIEKHTDGITLHLTGQRDERGPGMIRVSIVSNDIVHVTATPADSFATAKSLIVEDKPFPAVSWNMEEAGDSVIITTQRLRVALSQSTGAFTFSGDGKVKLREVPAGGKTFQADTLDDKRVYKIRQVFQSPANEAFYGLGGFQDGIMNYKGHDLELMQQNMVAINPFLVSSNDYGILWDNYSVTHFGDPRPYEHLNTMKLYTPDGKEGGLLARYLVNADTTKVYKEQVEPSINYEFRDQKANWPEGFPVAGSMVVWTGFMESPYSGVHKFLLYCSSYTKLWLNGKLVVDNWHQNWLPGTDPLTLEMEKGKKYSVRLEWRPDNFGNGPYMALKWLSPLPAEQQNQLSLASEVGDQIDYYFVNGHSIDSVISGYRQLTGKATIMPKWAMGLWQSRERYKTQQEVLDVVKEYRARNIPLDNIVLDWQYWPTSSWGAHKFDSTRFPDPDGMIDKLHDQYHAHFMISVWPKFDKGTEHYKQFENKGWLYKRNIETGTVDMLNDVFTFYDAYQPEARRLFWEQMNEKLFSKGVDAWWMDATEPEVISNVPNEEKALRMNPTALGPGAKYINPYSLVNSQAVYEGQRQVTPDQRVFILTRSAFAGQQRYAAATWSGDVASRWDDLHIQISSGLNFSMAGIPYWTTDIGGFEVEKRFEDVDGKDEEWREFMTRWLQFGTFCPLFRLHGQYPYREIYNIAPANHIAYKTMVNYDKLRYRLMPYIYSLAGHAYRHNSTIMRALVMDFQQDTNTHNINDEFMFGPAILVNPVYSYKARSRKVYLPEHDGGWYDLNKPHHFEGGKEIEAEAPVDFIPLYAKAGSIIPIGPDLQYSDEKPADPVNVFVFTGANGSFTLYEDENTNYNYEKGMYTEIPFTYDEQTGTLTIGQRKGSFPGMLEKRTFNITWITKDHPKALDITGGFDTQVTYDGTEQKLSRP